MEPPIIEGDLSHLVGYLDVERMDQVFTNLISNAIKNTAEDGEITLRIEVQEGEGEERSGTGLGLAIAKEIVQGHKGEVWVESKVGVGSTFSIVLPVYGKE